MNKLAPSFFLCMWLWTSLLRTSTADFRIEKDLSWNCNISYIAEREQACTCNIVNNQQILSTRMVVKENFYGYKIDCFFNNITFAEFQQIIDQCKFKIEIESYELKIFQCTISDTPFINFSRALNLKPRHLTLNDFAINVDNGLKPYLFENLTSVKGLHIINTCFNKSTLPIFENMPNTEYLELSNNSINFLPSELFESTSKLHSLNNKFSSLVDEFRLPPNLQMLQISYNNLQYISKKVFDNSTKLQLLYLSDNSIQLLDDGIFDNLSSLLTLDLRNNKLTRLSSNLFSHNHMLSFVDMTKACGEKLDTLLPGLFVNLTFLQHVRMGGNYFTKLPSNLFENCYKLSTVELNDNSLNTLPHSLFRDTTNLRELTLSNNELEFPNDKIFQNLGNLVKLQLRNAFSKNTSIPPSALFANMTSLNELHLNENNFIKLPVSLFENCSELEVLDLSDNQLKFLSDAFYPLRKLRQLHLARNHLVFVTNHAFRTLGSLRKLDLSSNGLTLFEKYTSDCFQKLTDIDLSHNPRLMEQVSWGSSRLNAILSPFRHCEKLETIELRNNSLEYMHFDKTYVSLPNLKLLDLSFNKIFAIRLREYIYYKNTRNRSYTVDLGDNRIETIPVHELDEIMEKNGPISNRQRCIKSPKFDEPKTSMNFTNNHIVCDCNALSLVHYVQQQQYCVTGLKFDDVRCHQPNWLRDTSLENIDLLDLKCPLNSTYPKLNENCPINCNCEYGSAGNRIIVNCTGAGMQTFPSEVLNISGFATELHFARNNFHSVNGLSNLPSVRNVTKLILSFNKLNNIDDLVLWGNLKVLELDNNQISYLSKDTIDHLNASKTLTNLTLHNNPWQCDCQHQYFAEFLQEPLTIKKLQTSYYNNITCQDNGQFILSRGNFCAKPIRNQFLYVLVPICVLLVIVIITGTVYYNYKTEITVWMYAHNICSCLINQHLLDKNKLYDAFVSFSGLDHEFVEEHLMPHLEPEFKLCVHHRDFVVGDYIGKQIGRAIENSRKIIIILTQNFLQSTWTQEEFRLSHIRVVREHCDRIIIILLEDIPTKHLDPLLKAYITMRTYLKWGDPLFWEKLRFALADFQNNTENQNQV